MLPIFARLGSVTIYMFGLLLFLGFIVATFAVWKQARQAGLEEEKVLDLYFLTVFLALIFGRITYIYFHWPIFAIDYSRMFLFLKYPGFSLVTIILVVVVISGLLAKKNNQDIFQIWDILAFGVSFFALFGYGGHFIDVRQSLWSVILAVGFLGLMVFLKIKAVKAKRGLFILCYLIFQVLSLLMTTWSVIYFGVLILLVGTFVYRYQILFKNIYDSISQRRS